MFGYEDNQGYVNPNALKDGEIVDVMILGWRFQPAYLKAIADENKITKEQLEGLGDVFKPKQPTVKEGGMTFDYAVIKRSRKDNAPKEYIFGTNPQELIEPTYVCYGQFDVDTPNQIQTKGFNYQQRVGGRGLDKQGNPFIVNDFPRADDKYFINGSFTSFAEIPDFVDGYTELEEKEKKRKFDWDVITTVFEGLTEEQIIEGLKENTAKRYLMCHISDKKPIYILPEKGVMFRCKVGINKNGYTTLVAFETKKIDNKYETIYYSAFNTYPVAPEDVEYANAIIKLKADNKKAREEAKKNKAEQQEEKLVEVAQAEFVPFWDDDGKPAF